MMVNDDKELGEKKKYVFFSDPDVIARRAEASASVSKSRILHPEEENPFNKVQNYQAQPHPFTFITAVKRKLALAAEYETCKQIDILENIPSVNKGNIPSYGGKMDFIKPLKVPDMKISPKNMDFSPRVSQKPEKSPKISLVHRKLDFSQSDETSFITGDEVEPLKAPEVSFTSSISKKKEHSRESSKEKENRSRRIKKDDTKGEDSSDTSKRRSNKHTSRKDYDEIVQKSKNDKFLANLSKESDLNDFLGKKSKQKVFVTSTTRKDDDRKLRSSSSHSTKSRDRSLEPRSRTFSSESISDRNSKCREASRAANNDPGGHKYPEDFQKLRTSSRDLHRKQFDSKNRQSSSSTSKVSKNSELIDHNLGLRTKEIDKNSKSTTPIALESKTESSEDAFIDPRRISFREDSYSNQEEFCNLVTPDMNLLYRPRKRRDSRNLPESTLEPENSTNHQKGREDSEENQENPQNVNLLHPTALHMQFQAELHLFDSYNESLRQVMDVENCLYNVQQEKARENLAITNFNGKASEKCSKNEIQRIKEDITQDDKKNTTSQFSTSRLEIESRKAAKEVQTQTANDIATQTEISQNISTKSQHPSITYTRGDLNQLSLGSIDEFDDFEGLEKLQRLRTMSEISLHETTSSIKTETGTEISISTRDVTCSFNKYLDLEMAQLIKDEAQMYDKIEMLFKSREKTLNDRSRKLVKLEEQKRALRDTGQDSRISSVKKKQRALLLKLQQEKDEMNRLKELHKLASQERKVMLQKQRNMFNPTMSTKNILTKLKRSADCQSPRRLSGPMKGYDIRSNSSISSVIDSDKSQIDKSKQGLPIRAGEFVRIPKSLPESTNSSQIDSPHKFDVKNRKFEEKMPKGDILRLRAHQLELEEKLNQSRQGNLSGNAATTGQEPKSESDTLVEDLTRKLVKKIDEIDDFPKSKGNEGDENGLEISKRSKASSGKFQNTSENKQIPKRKTSKSSKCKSNTNVLTENILWSRPNMLSSDEMSRSHKRSKAERDEDDRNSKNSILEELDMNESQNSIQTLVKHSKALKEKNCRLLKDIADEEAAKENFSTDQREIDDKNDEDDVQNLGNISTRSQVSTLTISRHSSGDSEKSYSRSVVIRSQDHRFKAPKKLEQVLNAREAALATRRNCVEDWIAWHARLKAEESRVARMEEAAYKLVSATTTALCNDTTVSSEASDVEGRVELLAEKLAERRAEKAKLKREARKQNKQKLKALEANLLNQIKKYDTTIHEMRKKLDSKRGPPRDNGKLAIEAKAVAGVKVPEIPLKRIQEIYRNSDLLRSRSESDLLTSYTAAESQTTSVNSQKPEKPHKVSSRSIESILEDAKNISMKKLTSKSSETISEIDQSTQEATKESPKSQKSSKSVDSTRTTEKSSEILTNSHESSPQPFSSKIDFLQLNNQNLNDDISNLENDLKALSEMMSKFSKKSDEKLRSALISTSDRDETPKNTSRDITEDLPRSQMSSEDLESIPEVLGSGNSSEKNKSPASSIKSAEIISMKQSNELDSISMVKSNDHSEDIININLNDENSKKTSEIIDVDVTEMISGIIPDPDTSKISEEIDFKARSKEILSEIEKSIILVKPLGNKTGNILEMSNSKLEENMGDLNEENEALSSDFNFIEGDIKSISEIISELSEIQRASILEESEKDSYSNNSRKENLPLSKSQETSDFKQQEEGEISRDQENINSTQEILEELTKQISDNNSKTFSPSETIPSPQDNENIMEDSSVHHVDEAGNESSLESQDDSNTRNISENQEISFDKQEKSNNEDDWTVSDSFEVANDTSKFESHVEPSLPEDSKNFERTTGNFEKSNEKIENLTMNFHDFENNIDVPYFIPNCESTSIDGMILRFQDPELEVTKKPENPSTDELDDILDIIERDSKQNDHKNRLNNSHFLGQVPDELQLKMTNDLSPTGLPELNLTADVEPVLQKLTEILQSVERNIARRTQSQKLDKIDSQESVGSETLQQDPSDKINSSRTESISENIEFVSENIQEIDFKDENLVETDIDYKGEINEHLDEALDRLSIHEESGCHSNSSVNHENFEGIDNNDSDEYIFKKPIAIQEVLRDPEYEDISEESMEVSEILDKSESNHTNRLSEIPEKFEKISKTDDVLRILDEISQQKVSILPQIIREPSIKPGISLDVEETKAFNATTENIEKIVKNVVNNKDVRGDSSEDSSEETPKEISEFDVESSKDPNSSRLDIETLDDNLLTPSSPEKSPKLDFLPGGSLTTSEKDIEIMIDKLRASLDQPGLEVAELDARLLRIEQLQIELQIKKLEAEEVSFYVREIPNKPPPPYTPPGGPKITSCLQISKNFPPPVVPSNVEELTAFTEKATLLIYDAKQQGTDIMALSAPADIYESAKIDLDGEKSEKHSEESSKNDRKIYNSFLFDLCKETVAEIYQSEYEKPGPSWTKPNFKTKTVVKLPTNVEELNDYVCKEVATLFGFKTKLQRENMVMRWSRKRRDRVDELLAREAQAEEDEWTKFHHDELAVKNELTVAILDTLMRETTSVVKTAYAKKRKVVV